MLENHKLNMVYGTDISMGC